MMGMTGFWVAIAFMAVLLVLFDLFYYKLLANTLVSTLVFFKEVRQETEKVTPPSWKEVWITTIMVLVMVALTSIFFLLADMVISWAIKLVLGLGQ